MYIKFKYHSVVDVITNSSTIIYTNSDGCIEPAKEMIREFAKAMGFEEDVDSMFSFCAFIDEDLYIDYIEDFDEEDFEDLEYEYPFKDLDWKERSKKVSDIIEKVGSGAMEKPKWMTDAEASKKSDYDDYYDSTLYIFPKDDKYKSLAKAIEKFLYSTETEAYYQ